MSKILVFSDTHGFIDTAKHIIGEEKDAEYIFHLGDHARDAFLLQDACGKRVVCVRGNCDYDPSVPLREIVPIGGTRILLVHGHQYRVDYSLLQLTLAAQEAEVSAVCFGHTHRSLVSYENGILLLNPGSISRPRDAMPSYGILDIRKDGVLGHIINAQKKPL